MEAAARSPGFAQGVTLVVIAWVATIAAVVLAPVLPEMSRVFGADPLVAIKIPLVATGPALFVALLAIPLGIWSDRIGRLKPLLAALLIYGLAGTAPLWLQGLDSIVLSRIALGIVEAAIMTVSTALIGDYFEGTRRQRWLAAQTGSAPLIAVVLVLVAGFLGGFGWRTPFWIYAWGFVLIPLVLIFLWEPARRNRLDDSQHGASVEAFSWAGPIRIALVIVLGMIMFLVTVVQFGFLVSERGMTLAQDIGKWSALVTLGNPIGSLIFALVALSTRTRMLLAWTLYAVGFLLMSLLPSVDAAIAGGFVANLGAGFFLPTAITWLLSTIPSPVRGRASGLFTAAVFLGQFLGPLVVAGLAALTGSLSHAILVCGIVCAAAAAVTLLAGRRGAASTV